MTPARGRRVLLVEDGHTHRARLRALLARIPDALDAPYVCMEADTGERALAVLTDPGSPPPYAVVVDLKLPGMSSHELLQALRGDDGAIPFPVIVVTGALDSEEAARILRSGAQDFIGTDGLTPEGLSRVLENARERFLIQCELRETRRHLEASEALARDRLDELEAIYATAPVGLCFMDRDLRYVRINAALAALNGRPATEHIGLTRRKVLPAMDHDAFNERLRRVLQTGIPALGIELHVETVAQPGVPRDFLASYLPFRDRQGAIQGLNTVVQEVTELKQTERESRRRAERLRLAFQLAKMGSWDWDIATDRVVWSDDMFPLFGITPAQFAGTLTAFLAAVHPEDRPRVRRAIDEAVERDAPYDVEFRVVHPEGSVRWAAAKGKLQRDADGNPCALVGVDMDITARKEAEARREALFAAERAARAEAERIGRMKDEFLATLSHELRTPLHAILGWSAVLRRGVDDADARQRAVEVIDRNARLQSQLVDDLLDMSQILAGKLRFTPQWTSLARAAQAAIDTVRPTADLKGVTLEVELGSDADVLHGDPDRLQQIVWNLLSNAIKFTPRGGRVRVAMAREGETLALSVLDTGAGIDPELLPHVFERFRQADASAERQHGGLGLGLSIARQLAELHGGTVRAASLGLGRGSTFTLLLPQSRGGATDPARMGAA